MAIANGLIGATALLVTTGPEDIPGMVIAGSVTYLGTRYFCEVGWL